MSSVAWRTYQVNSTSSGSDSSGSDLEASVMSAHLRAVQLRRIESPVGNTHSSPTAARHQDQTHRDNVDDNVDDDHPAGPEKYAPTAPAPARPSLRASLHSPTAADAAHYSHHAHARTGSARDRTGSARERTASGVTFAIDAAVPPLPVPSATAHTIAPAITPNLGVTFAIDSAVPGPLPVPTASAPTSTPNLASAHTDLPPKLTPKFTSKLTPGLTPELTPGLTPALAPQLMQQRAACSALSTAEPASQVAARELQTHAAGEPTNVPAAISAQLDPAVSAPQVAVPVLTDVATVVAGARGATLVSQVATPADSTAPIQVTPRIKDASYCITLHRIRLWAQMHCKSFHPNKHFFFGLHPECQVFGFLGNKIVMK